MVMGSQKKIKGRPLKSFAHAVALIDSREHPENPRENSKYYVFTCAWNSGLGQASPYLAFVDKKTGKIFEENEVAESDKHNLLPCGKLDISLDEAVRLIENISWHDAADNKNPYEDDTRYSIDEIHYAYKRPITSYLLKDTGRYWWEFKDKE